MDTSIESHRESLRKMMMKHEERFKQQVRELHRLYKVQKMLMAELRTKELKLHSNRNVTPLDITDTTNRFSSSTSTSETSRSYTTTDHLGSESGYLQLYNTRAGPSSRELSICSEDPLGTQKGFDLDWHAVDDSATVAQNQTTMFRKHLKGKTGMEGSELCDDGESGIELTLSIGCGADKKESKNFLYSDLGCSTPTSNQTRQLVSTTPVRLDGREEGSGTSLSYNGEGLQGSPWMFQSLSLNRS